MRRNLLLVLGVALILGTGSPLVEATTIDFFGYPGGTLSYSGDAAPLVGNDLPISFVFGNPPGTSSSIVVVGGLMDFTTGIYTSALDLPGPLFTYSFDGGGSISITGGVPAAGIANNSTLLSATFTGDPAFTYGGGGLAALTSVLSVDYLNPELSEFFGFAPLTTTGYGFLAQIDMMVDFNGSSWGFGTPGPGKAFSGSQLGANVVAATAPEPATLILLGSGLAGVSFVGRRRLRKGPTNKV